MWDLPGPGLEHMSPALAGGFLTTAPPGKSPTLNSWWPTFPPYLLLLGLHPIRRWHHHMPCCTSWKLFPFPHSSPPSLTSATASTLSLIWLLPLYNPDIQQQEESFKNTIWIMKYFIHREYIWIYISGIYSNVTSTIVPSTQPEKQNPSIPVKSLVPNCTPLLLQPPQQPLHWVLGLPFIFFILYHISTYPQMTPFIFAHLFFIQVELYLLSLSCFFFTVHYVYEIHPGRYM